MVFGGFASYWDLARNQMTRLLDTDLWYRTDIARTDLRSWYPFSPNDALEPLKDWAERTAAFRPDPLNPRRFMVAGGPDNPFTPRDETWSVIELPATPPRS